MWTQGFHNKKFQQAVGAASLLALALVVSKASRVRADNTPPQGQAQLQFEDQNNGGNLRLKVHPKSPIACGLDIIEVGTQKPGEAFDPHFALLRDRFDETYPGIAPKIRRLYAYNLPPNDVRRVTNNSTPNSRNVETIKSPPVDVFNVDQARGRILAELTYKLARTLLVATGNILQQAAVLTVDQFVQSFLKKREYQRDRAFYTLQLIDESNLTSQTGVLSREEIRNFLAMGREGGPAGLLITPEYLNLVYEGQMNVRRRSRIVNYANLLSAINREGLVAQPLFRDFVMVYLDTKRPTPHSINLIDTSLALSPEDEALRQRSVLSNGLIPLGLYAIGDSADRLLTVDLQHSDRIGNRNTIKTLTDIGAQYSAGFIGFPFNITILATQSGAQFLLNKAGKNILTDMLQTEAELAALVDSGIAGLDPTLMAKIRQEMGQGIYNDITQIQQTLPATRAENANRMTEMLEKEGANICSEISRIREDEFRSEYLGTAGEISRGTARILTWLGLKSRASYIEERRKIIHERTPIVEARRMLRTYDPNHETILPEHLIQALNLLGPLRESTDADSIGNLIQYGTDVEVIKAAIEAAEKNGNPGLIGPLLNFLSGFQPNSPLANTDGAIEALHALHGLDFKKVDFVFNIYRKTHRVLDPLLHSSNEEISLLVGPLLTKAEGELSGFEQTQARPLTQGGG